MSQVEFVMVLATIFKSCKIEPALRRRESMTRARQKLVDLMNDSSPVVSLRMNKPEEVHLRWSKR